MPIGRTAAVVAAIAAGLSAAGVSAAYRTDVRAARERLTGHSRVITTPSGPIEVAEAGAGSPVLVVHGSAGGFDMGLQVGQEVLGDGFRIVAPSRFGYLRTPMPSPDYGADHATQADAFAALLDTLAIASVPVVAVSAGAQSATQLALRHPERVTALVLITPALYLPPGPGRRDAGPPDFIFDKLLASDLFAWTVVRLAPNLLVRVAGVPKALTGQVTAQDRQRILGWFFPAAARHVGLGHDMRTTTPVAPDLPIEDLAMPVLLISAADDPYLTADVVRYSATRLPTAKVVICESGGHILLHQDDRVRREVRGFLSAGPPPP